MSGFKLEPSLYLLPNSALGRMTTAQLLTTVFLFLFLSHT